MRAMIYTLGLCRDDRAGSNRAKIVDAVKFSDEFEVHNIARGH